MPTRGTLRMALSSERRDIRSWPRPFFVKDESLAGVTGTYATRPYSGGAVGAFLGSCAPEGARLDMRRARSTERAPQL